MADDDNIADRMTRLLDELESLPGRERMAALDTLTPEERDVLGTLAAQRAAFYGERAKANADMAETHRWLLGWICSRHWTRGKTGLMNSTRRHSRLVCSP